MEQDGGVYKNNPAGCFRERASLRKEYFRFNQKGQDGIRLKFLLFYQAS
ncbi:MAG: hypothetical protein TRG1_121 [Flavobacteriaceae bacterium FS1-H7996/R]|nr:MAG: hypothetical protein TRG1_121 [Flavobacteriaceae bacterium FS1-H7996/R]